MNFERAIELVLRSEGGLVDDPDDAGGLTNFGISIKAYPELGREGIRTLTRNDAAAIYHRDYCDELPAPLRLLVFDFAVNCGSKRAATTS